MIYETKGLSLEQVSELYENEPRAWKSRKYQLRPTDIAVEDYTKDTEMSVHVEN